MTPRPLPLTLYDTYLKSQFTLSPDLTVQKDTIQLYSCGPTVYSYQHIGNLRAAWLPDMITKTARLAGWQVQWVSNITDVGHLVGDGDEGQNVTEAEDKLEKGAKRENKTPQQIADFYNQDFRQQCQAVGIELPSGRMNPKATEYIQEQMILALTLLQDGLAYLLEDGIYFDSLKFEQLEDQTSNLNTTIKLILEIQKKQKQGNSNHFTGRDIANITKNPADFALWKFVSQNSLQKWMIDDFKTRSKDSDRTLTTLIELLSNTLSKAELDKLLYSWGCPGWHSECVAMICGILGRREAGEPFSFAKFSQDSRPVIDLHLGGEDHIDIHHKNEILQSEALGFHLSQYWVHNKFVLVDGKKMSKSLGNVFLVTGAKQTTGFESIQEKGFDPLAYRLMLMEHHYSEPMNFTWDKLEQSQARLFNLRKEAAKLASRATTQVPGNYIISAGDFLKKAKTLQFKNLIQPLLDNLNTPLFVSQYQNMLIETANMDMAQDIASDRDMFGLNLMSLMVLDLEILHLELFPSRRSQAIDQLAKRRLIAKEIKNYSEADQIRKQLLSRGWQVDDYAWGYGLWWNPTLIK